MTMHASLAQPHRLSATLAPAPAPLLAPEGAAIVLGESPRAQPIRAAAHTMFGPRGAAMAGPDGPLIVCDTGHHRLLGWCNVPSADGAPADWVVGQPDFACEGRNGKSIVGAATLNVPTGIAIGGGVLAVADAWNHRVLLWHGLPDRSNRPADIVLGQADFSGGLANRGADAPAADTLNWCYGVAICDGRLYVADTGNRRVLMWDAVPRTNGAPADLILGQPDFTTRDDAGAAGMRWPHAVATAGGCVFVADAGSSRIMVWRGLPQSDGAPCDALLGQAGRGGTDHNRGAYDPGPATLNMPYGIAALGHLLVVADTANSRLIGYDIRGYDLGEIETGMAADRLAGQRRFHEKGENRWETAGRDTLCWPYAVSACGDTAIVADSGNSRVLLWQAA